jgi:hypothetical protein
LTLNSIRHPRSTLFVGKKFAKSSYRKYHGRAVTDSFSMKTQTATQSRQAVAYFMMKKMKQLQYSLVRYL